MAAINDKEWLETYNTRMINFVGVLRRYHLCTTASYWWANHELTNRYVRLQGHFRSTTSDPLWEP